MVNTGRLSSVGAVDVLLRKSMNPVGLSSLTAIAGFVVAVWLGSYLATHTTRTRVARLATLTVLSLAGYFLHAVLCLHVPAVQAGFLWRRFLGWFAIPPLPLWFHLTAELPPAHLFRRERWVVWAAYGVAAVLVGLWLFGSWTFSTTSLVPYELGLPVGLFGLVVSVGCLGNLWYNQAQVQEPLLRYRQRLLGLVTLLAVTGGVYWPLLTSALRLPWAPALTLATGEIILVMALVTLAYAVARHNLFLAGRWVLRDFIYHVVAIATVVVLYMTAIGGAWALAAALNSDTLTLVLVAVVGLAIMTHLMADRARGLWDALFFRELHPLRMDLRMVIRDMSTQANVQEQVQQVVESLARLSGASLVCLALWEEGELVVKAAAPRHWVGCVLARVERGQRLLDQLAVDRLPLQGIALMEPLRAFRREMGVLLLGEKGVGEGYDRQERVWVATLAARLAILLEDTRLQEEFTRQLATIAGEIREISSQKAGLQQEMQAALAGARWEVDYHELREALRYYSSPDRLAEILRRPGSSLATLPPVRESAPHTVEGLRKVLADAVDALRPPEALPSLEAVRERPVRKKRRRHLPAAVADYYTLRLIMAGYTHEAVAEELDVSPRQVRNYLERATTRLGAVLETMGGLVHE